MSQTHSSKHTEQLVERIKSDIRASEEDTLTHYPTVVYYFTQTDHMTYQRLCGWEGMKVFGFGQFGDQIFWIHIHLRDPRIEHETAFYFLTNERRKSAQCCSKQWQTGVGVY